MTDMVSCNDSCSLPQTTNDDDDHTKELNSDDKSSEQKNSTASTSNANLPPYNNEIEINSNEVEETDLNTQKVTERKCQHTKCIGNYLIPANVDVRPAPIQNDVEYNEAISSISHLNLQEILSTVKEKLELYKRRNMAETVKPDSSISMKETCKCEESIENLLNSTDEDFFEDALDELSVTSHLEELNLNSDDSDAEVEAITDIFNILPVESDETNDIENMVQNEQSGVEADTQLSEKDQTKISGIFVFGSPDSNAEKNTFNFKTDANSTQALTSTLNSGKKFKVPKGKAWSMLDNFKDKHFDFMKSGVSILSENNNEISAKNARKNDCATNDDKKNILTNEKNDLITTSDSSFHNNDIFNKKSKLKLDLIPLAGTSKSPASWKFVFSNEAENHDPIPFVFNDNDKTKNGITKGGNCFKSNAGKSFKFNQHTDSNPAKLQSGTSTNVPSTNFNMNNSLNTKLLPAFQFNTDAFKELKSKNFTFSSNLPNKCVFKFESNPTTKDKNTSQLDMKESSTSKETQGVDISKGANFVVDKSIPSTSGLNIQNNISDSIPTYHATPYSAETSSNSIEREQQSISKVTHSFKDNKNREFHKKPKSDQHVRIVPGPSAANGSENNVKLVNSSSLSKENVAPKTWKDLNLQSKSWKNDFNKIFSNLSAETKHNTPPIQSCTKANNMNTLQSIPDTTAEGQLKDKQLHNKLTKQTKAKVNNHAQLQNGRVNNSGKGNIIQVPPDKPTCSSQSTQNGLLLKTSKDTRRDATNTAPEKLEGNVGKDDVFNFTARPIVQTRGPPRKAVRRAPQTEKSEPKAKTQFLFNSNTDMNPTTGCMMPIKFDNTQLQRDRNHRLNSNGDINKDSNKNIFTAMNSASQTNVKRNIIFIDLSGVTHKVDSSGGKSCLFTLKPMTASNTIVFQISETRSFECSVNIGFTSRNPETVKTFGLHGDSQKWTEHKDYWDLRPLNGLIPGDTVYTWLTKSGEVMVRRNDSDPFTLMRVIKLEKLWGFVDFGSDVKEVKLFELRADKPESPTARQRSVNETVLGECSICFDNPIDSVLYKCGHTCLCHACALDRWQGRGEGRCPICRERIYDVIKIYA